MFWPTRMSKVRLIGLKSNLKKTIDVLEEYGGVEIKKLSSKEVENSKALEGNSKIIEKLVKTEAMLNILDKQEVKIKTKISDLKDFSREASFKKIETQIENSNSKLGNAQNEIEILKDEKTNLRMFANFNIDFSEFRSESLELAAGTVSAPNTLLLEDKLHNRCYYTKQLLWNGKVIYLIAFEKGKINLDDYSSLNFERVLIPHISNKPSDELKKIDKKIVELEKEKTLLKKELNSISNKNYSKIVALKEFLEMESAKANLPENFLGTNHSFILEAYLPERNFEKFEKFINDKFGKKVFVQNFSSKELEKNHETTPTLIEHHPLVKPFGELVKFISTPKSNELDTTLIFLIVFPIFYGMIVGDFIYGIISFLMAKWILGKVSVDGILNSVSKVWMYGSIPTMIFGLIFDEFGGYSHNALLELIGIHGVQLYHGYERLQNIELLLGVTLLIGVFTMSMAFLLGYINAVRQGDSKHALAKIGWFGMVVFGTVLITTLMFNAFPQDFVIPTAILMLISFIPILRAEGIVGIMEIPSVVGNVLSFARILAVGLVGVVIASILNDLAFPSLDKGILLIIFLPLYIFGHLFNIFLAMFEALIQGARLNFVEFYSKFYEGGGKEFAPFKFERRYIKE